MLLWFAETFRDDLGILNVFRYLTFRVPAALATGLLITLVLYPWFIRRLQFKQVGENIRHDGPESHLQKAGTPTMGGTLIILAVLTSGILWMDLSNLWVWLTLAVMVSYGILGFIDDYLKFRKKGGLRARTKLVWQFAVAGGVMTFLFSFLIPQGMLEYSLDVYIPFLRSDTHYFTLPSWLYIAFGSFVVVAASNGVNLTDGLDGLAIGPVIIASGTFLILCYLTNLQIAGFDVSSYLLIPKVGGVQELTILCAAVIGAGFGFLWYNTFPAQVFMGDVGSLALGGVLGCLAVFSKNEFLSVIILGIFVLESVSVITQTTSYKLTGKRVFRMAPIHHHFELKGWAEPKIIVRFWIIAFMLSVIALANIKLR